MSSVCGSSWSPPRTDAGGAGGLGLSLWTELHLGIGSSASGIRGGREGRVLGDPKVLVP